MRLKPGIRSVSRAEGYAAGLAVILCLLFPAAAHAQDRPYPEGAIPGNVYAESDESYTVLLVEKSSETLFVVDVRDNIPTVSRYHSVITGKFDGDKLREGDQKTPEGIYFITGYIPQERLNTSLYGVGAFPINYPNIVDRLNGKTGYGIWLHGRGSLTNGRNTRGCVSLRNDDFRNLKGLVSRGTPVIISERLEFFSPDEYQQHRRRHIGYIKGLVTAWEEGDIDAFSEYFDPRFRTAGGLPYRKYLEKKGALMKLYPDRRIEISDIRVFKENSRELMYQFDQLYCADNMLSFGTKRLYLDSDESGAYRVVAEEFSEGSPLPYIEDSVEAFLSEWKEGWRSQDIGSYIAFYDESFTNGGMDLQGWRAYKEDLFRKTRIDDVRIRGVKVKVLSPKRIRVTFEQEYLSDRLTDRGIKTLILKGCPGDYRIVSERWRPL